MIKRNLCVILAILFLGGISPASADLVGVSYLESDLGGGLYSYEFILTNSSNPIDGLGLWFVDLDLGIFDEGEYIRKIDLPYGWEYIAGPEPEAFSSEAFIALSSLYPGLPDLGTDVPPGEILGGFLFETNSKLGPISFSALLDTYQFDDDGFPIFESSTGSVTPVPESATLILLATGLTGIASISRKKNFFNRHRQHKLSKKTLWRGGKGA